MTEEQILAGHLSDLARRAYDKSIYTYSGFLSPAQQAYADTLRGDFPIAYELFGGYEMAERQVIGFGSSDLFGYEGTFPISVIEVCPLSEKFAENLSHRDYLGSLMNLGIERETIGDILIKDKLAYIFALDEISEHICSELTRVRHTSVRCVVTDGDIDVLKPTLVSETFPASSLRIDVIISTACRLSRRATQEYFEKGLVTLNGRPAVKLSYQLNIGDVFSVRGIGKFRFSEIGGTSKRGKTYVTLERYV